MIVFAVLSAGILLLSWPAVRDPRSHGFYRFFAFESVLALVLLNLEHWFQEPLVLRQIVSWVLLVLSGFLAVHGFRLLRVVGRPEGPIEQTTVLVEVGAYKYIRHPLYGSLLYLAWGAFLKRPSLESGALVLAATGFLVATAKVEERENREKFGAEYAAYVKRTRMFVPFVL